MKLTPLKGAFALIVGMIVLKIFFPWWFVSIVIGGATCFAVYRWVIAKTGVKPLWAKILAGTAIVFFLGSFAMNFIGAKWPWVAKAMDNLQIYASFWVTDKIDTGYDARIALDKYATREMLIKSKMNEQRKIQKGLQEKILKGEVIDENLITRCENRIDELQEELNKLHLARSGVKKLPGTMGSIIPKIFLFGICMFGFGIGLQACTKKQRGGALMGFGIFVLVVWGLLALFAEDIFASANKISLQDHLRSAQEPLKPLTKPQTVEKFSKFLFQVKAGVLTTQSYAIHSSNKRWFRWWGPDDTQIFDKNGGKIGLLLTDYGERREFIEGVRFLSHQDGIILVFEADKQEDLPSIDRVKLMWQKEQNDFLRTFSKPEPSTEQMKNQEEKELSQNDPVQPGNPILPFEEPLAKDIEQNEKSKSEAEQPQGMATQTPVEERQNHSINKPVIVLPPPLFLGKPHNENHRFSRRAPSREDRPQPKRKERAFQNKARRPFKERDLRN